jgi:multicomponent Na+:H+ antiporter subunit C
MHFDYILGKYNYWGFIILLVLGLYALIAEKNLIKKVIALSILQTAVILYFISTASKKGATIPIILDKNAPHLVKAIDYINPLPHCLMLTAIVVMVSTTGVALALLIRLYRRYKSLEEDEIIKSEIE